MSAAESRTPQIALHEKSGLWFPTDCNADADGVRYERVAKVHGDFVFAPRKSKK